MWHKTRRVSVYSFFLSNFIFSFTSRLKQFSPIHQNPLCTSNTKARVCGFWIDRRRAQALISPFFLFVTHTSLIAKQKAITICCHLHKEIKLMHALMHFLRSIDNVARINNEQLKFSPRGERASMSDLWIAGRKACSRQQPGSTRALAHLYLLHRLCVLWLHSLIRPSINMLISHVLWAFVNKIEHRLVKCIFLALKKIS